MNVDTPRDRSCYFPRTLDSFLTNALKIIESENPF